MKLSIPELVFGALEAADPANPLVVVGDTPGFGIFPLSSKT